MAGAFTHMTIIVEATKSFPVKNNLGRIIRANKNFVTLGSVSPDIPYLAYLAGGGFNWADIMHYHNTNRIVDNAIHSLGFANSKGNIWNCQLSWLLGFVSHLVADATIHPIVEAIVGPYTDKKTNNNHRICEMVQDVMILKEIMNLKLPSAEYTNFIRSSLKHKYFRNVSKFWAIHAEVNSPFSGKFPTDKIIKSYTDLLDTAEGGSAIAKFFRHIGVDYMYSSYDELKKDSPNLIAKYYEKIKLPNGMIGSFKKDGFEYAAQNLVKVWSKIERSLFSKDNIAGTIPNWNLDTGMDQETGTITYWS